MALLKAVKQVIWIVLIISAFFLGVFSPAQANGVPLIEMNFRFQYMFSPIPKIEYGNLYYCENHDCSSITTNRAIGKQRFLCQFEKCTAIPLGIKGEDYYILRVTFSDGRTLESNAFTFHEYHQVYKVSVYSDHLEVIETGEKITPWLIIFAAGRIVDNAPLLIFYTLITISIFFILGGAQWKIPPAFTIIFYILGWVLAVLLSLAGYKYSYTIPTTVLIEFTMAWLFLAILRKPKLLSLTLVVMINVVSQIFMIFALPGITHKYSWISILEFEIAIWIFEAFMLFLPQRKQFQLTELLLMSFLMNAASFGLWFVK